MQRIKGLSNNSQARRDYPNQGRVKTSNSLAKSKE
jgi:hypothetical protein